jgi:hypothetical protein
MHPKFFPLDDKGKGACTKDFLRKNGPNLTYFQGSFFLENCQI